MEAQLLSIAGIYRTIETDLPKEVAGKAAKVRLEEKASLSSRYERHTGHPINLPHLS